MNSKEKSIEKTIGNLFKFYAFLGLGINEGSVF
jgi:hypothetical protein